MTAAAAVLAIAAFAVAFRLARIVSVAADILRLSRATVEVMTDRDLNDDAKEAAVRAASLRLMQHFAAIVWRSAAALAVPAMLLYGGAAAGLFTLEAVGAFLLRWDVIALGSGAVLAAALIRR